MSDTPVCFLSAQEKMSSTTSLLKLSARRTVLPATAVCRSAADARRAADAMRLSAGRAAGAAAMCRAEARGAPPRGGGAGAAAGGGAVGGGMGRVGCGWGGYLPGGLIARTLVLGPGERRKGWGGWLVAL